MDSRPKRNAFVYASMLCIATIMIASCGDGTARAAATGSAAASAATAADPLGRYDPPIDISFVRCVDNDLAANILPKTPGETIEDNRWLRLYSEQLGINIRYDWTVRGSYTDDAYTRKINVTLASGDIPEVVTVNSAQLKQLADSDMIEDMTDYYDTFAAPLTKDVFSQQGDSVLGSATFGGRLMAIPKMDSSIECAQFLWIRKDWLDKLGLKPPRTMAELLETAKAFTTRDPDGNGVADTYGLALTKNLYSGAMGAEAFFAGFHSYPNFWTEDKDGKLAYGSVQPETKLALKALAAMYKAGQLDREFAVKDGAKVAESIAAGKIGIDFGEQWNPMYPLISNYRNDDKADWVGYSLVSADSDPVKVPLRFRTRFYFAVKKGYAHPEAVVKLVNMHLEKNWGETNDFGKYYMPAENGNVGVWKFSPVDPAPPFKNLNAFLAIDEARKAGDFSALQGEAKVIQSNIAAYAAGDKSQWGWEKIYGANGVYNVLRDYQKNDQLLMEKFYGAPTPTMVERKATLEKMELESFIKIIMGAEPIESFDKFVKDWNTLGGADITKEVNDWYASMK